MKNLRKAESLILSATLFLLQAQAMSYGVRDSAEDLESRKIGTEEFLDSIPVHDWVDHSANKILRNEGQNCQFYDFDLEMNEKNRLNLYCEVLVNTDACKQAGKENPGALLECDRNFPDPWGLVDGTLGCLHGLFDSAWTTLKFFFAIVWFPFAEAGRLLTAEETKTMGMLSSLAAMYHKHREGDEENGIPPKGRLEAAMAVFGDLMKKLGNAVINYFAETYKNFGCYNSQYKTKLVCETIGEIVLPPAVAIGLLKKYGLIRKFSRNRNKPDGGGKPGPDGDGPGSPSSPEGGPSPSGGASGASGVSGNMKLSKDAQGVVRNSPANEFRKMFNQGDKGDLLGGNVRFRTPDGFGRGTVVDFVRRADGKIEGVIVDGFRPNGTFTQFTLRGKDLERVIMSASRSVKAADPAVIPKIKSGRWLPNRPRDEFVKQFNRGEFAPGARVNFKVKGEGKLAGEIIRHTGDGIVVRVARPGQEAVEHVLKAESKGLQSVVMAGVGQVKRKVPASVVKNSSEGAFMMPMVENAGQVARRVTAPFDNFRKKFNRGEAGDLIGSHVRFNRSPTLSGTGRVVGFAKSAGGEINGIIVKGFDSKGFAKEFTLRGKETLGKVMMGKDMAVRVPAGARVRKIKPWRRKASNEFRREFVDQFNNGTFAPQASVMFTSNGKRVRGTIAKHTGDGIVVRFAPGEGVGTVALKGRALDDVVMAQRKTARKRPAGGGKPDGGGSGARPDGNAGARPDGGPQGGSAASGGASGGSGAMSMLVDHAGKVMRGPMNEFRKRFNNRLEGKRSNLMGSHVRFAAKDGGIQSGYFAGFLKNPATDKINGILVHRYTPNGTYDVVKLKGDGLKRVSMGRDVAVRAADPKKVSRIKSGQSASNAARGDFVRYFNRGNFGSKPWVRFKTKNGKTLTGEVIRHTGDGVVVRASRGAGVFTLKGGALDNVVMAQRKLAKRGPSSRVKPDGGNGARPAGDGAPGPGSGARPDGGNGARPAGDGAPGPGSGARPDGGNGARPAGDGAPGPGAGAKPKDGNSGKPKDGDGARPDGDQRKFYGEDNPAAGTAAPGSSTASLADRAKRRLFVREAVEEILPGVGKGLSLRQASVIKDSRRFFNPEARFDFLRKELSRRGSFMTDAQIRKIMNSANPKLAPIQRTPRRATSMRPNPLKIEKKGMIFGRNRAINENYNKFAQAYNNGLFPDDLRHVVVKGKNGADELVEIVGFKGRYDLVGRLPDGTERIIKRREMRRKRVEYSDEAKKAFGKRGGRNPAGEVAPRVGSEGPQVAAQAPSGGMARAGDAIRRKVDEVKERVRRPGRATRPENTPEISVFVPNPGSKGPASMILANTPEFSAVRAFADIQTRLADDLHVTFIGRNGNPLLQGGVAEVGLQGGLLRAGTQGVKPADVAKVVVSSRRSVKKPDGARLRKIDPKDGVADEAFATAFNRGEFVPGTQVSVPLRDAGMLTAGDVLRAGGAAAPAAAGGKRVSGIIQAHTGNGVLISGPGLPDGAVLVKGRALKRVEMDPGKALPPGGAPSATGLMERFGRPTGRSGSGGGTRYFDPQAQARHLQETLGQGNGSWATRGGRDNLLLLAESGFVKPKARPPKKPLKLKRKGRVSNKSPDNDAMFNMFAEQYNAGVFTNPHVMIRMRSGDTPAKIVGFKGKDDLIAVVEGGKEIVIKRMNLNNVRSAAAP